MGRRKERRLAAMTGGGRRVKLDLFAEPSGDLGGSSDQNDIVGIDDGAKNQAELPNSPPTSGQESENPLALLGQYSDEDSSVEQEQAVSGDTSVTVERQAKTDAARGKEEFCLQEGNNPGAQVAEHLEIENPVQLTESLKKTEVDCPTNNCGVESGVMPEASSFQQAVGDVILGWKLVFHEGSNRYYYWNTATDETSWEVPDILAQTSESADGKRDTADNGKTRVSGALNQSADVNGRNSCEPSIEVLNEECRGEMLDQSTGLEQRQLKGSSPPNGTVNCATLPESNICVTESNNEREHNVNVMESVVYEGGEDLASSLVKCGEHLLEQLGSVVRAKCNMHGYNQILRYAYEVETRVADMKSLESCGSSLLPFWLHSQKRFQKLEMEVRGALQGLEPGQLKGVGAENDSHENIYHVSETNPIEKNAVCSSADSEVPNSSGTTKLQKNEMEVYCRGVSSTEFVSSNGCLTPYTDINLGGKAEGDGITQECVEEMDMDIDMEVEDANPIVADPLGAPHHIPLEESAAARELCSIPPPPEEEWIPPPPPDTEPFPPPPPDEPPEIQYPQASDVGSLQSFSYSEQYMYNPPIYGYYAQANTDLPSSNLYISAEASQPTVSHPAMYFEPVPNGYPSALAVNPVEPTVYYTLQDQHPTESSVSQSSTVPKTSISEATGSVHIELESASLAKKVNVAAVDVDPKTSFHIQSSHALSEGLTKTSVADNVSVLSIPDAIGPVAPTTKAQTKVIRNKKKSVTSVSSLRSNRKVSSLVDKWKAAKEELQDEEEEEEPRSALEILEKKKQREIEEWYARQIVSGEAKDNANFQPLGGDWRERVKRKRARLASEPPRATPDTVIEGNQQQPPDLEEVTRGLPSGWQAYWDDSSKQIYYGNSVTSETTWVRPTTS